MLDGEIHLCPRALQTVSERGVHHPVQVQAKCVQSVLGSVSEYPPVRFQATKLDSVPHLQRSPQSSTPDTSG